MEKEQIGMQLCQIMVEAQPSISYRWKNWAKISESIL